MNMAQGYYFAQVGIALRVFRQQHDGLSEAPGCVSSTPRMGLMPCSLTFAIEPYEPAHAVDVGKGNGAHAHCLAARNQLMHRAYAGVEGEDRMGVKGNEIHLIVAPYPPFGSKTLRIYPRLWHDKLFEFYALTTFPNTANDSVYPGSTSMGAIASFAGTSVTAARGSFPHVLKGRLAVPQHGRDFVNITRAVFLPPPCRRP